MTEIDITPKWKQMAQVMLLVLDNPEATKESKEEVKQEFIRMAGLVDEMNKKLQSENK